MLFLVFWNKFVTPGVCKNNSVLFVFWGAGPYTGVDASAPSSNDTSPDIMSPFQPSLNFLPPAGAKSSVSSILETNIFTPLSGAFVPEVERVNISPT